MNTVAESIGFKTFSNFLSLKENNELLSQPHTVSADPPMKIPEGLVRLAEAFKKSKEVALGKEIDSKAGGEKDVTMKSKKLFVVGGAVRDYVLGHTPRNYDLCTDAHPDEVERIAMHCKPPIQVVSKNKKSGVVRVSVDGEQYDIATMRKKAGKEGETIFTTNPAEDCEHRDVTINCLYYDISAKKIFDYTGGLRHLKDGVVKFVGKADERLAEDGMRKYRYARMLNKVPNGKADKDSKEAIMKHGEGDGEESPEKVREEFWKGMEDLHTSADKYLKTYSEMGLLKTVFPKLELSLDFPTCKTCKTRPLVLASLLKNNRPPKLVEQLKALKYTDREIKDAVYLVNLLFFSPEYIYDYKKELTRTSLTKRQILDWAKINNLNSDMIEKMLDHNMPAQSDNSGLTGESLLNRVRSLAAKSFQERLRN